MVRVAGVGRQATCLLAAPPALWRRAWDDGSAAGHAGAPAAADVMVHVRFSFDRTPFRRMHAALAEAARVCHEGLQLLPVSLDCLTCNAC